MGSNLEFASDYADGPVRIPRTQRSEPAWKVPAHDNRRGKACHWSMTIIARAPGRATGCPDGCPAAAGQLEEVGPLDELYAEISEMTGGRMSGVWSGGDLVELVDTFLQRHGYDTSVDLAGDDE
jgi:hypothetical protein